MTSVFEIFDPGMAHWRRQKDLEKVLVHTTDQGASGPKPLDLESGKVEIELPAERADHTEETDHIEENR